MNRRTFLESCTAILAAVPLVGRFFQPKKMEWRLHDQVIGHSDIPKRVRCVGGPLDGKVFDLPRGIQGQCFVRKYAPYHGAEPHSAHYSWTPTVVDGTMVVVSDRHRDQA